MRAASFASAGLSNSGGVKICTDRTKTCTVSQLQASITEIIKLQKPNGTKAWAFIAGLFGLKERAAKYRLSNTASYTIEELQALIHGEDGYVYFEALMADAKPKWWSDFQETVTLCKARALQHSARQAVLSLDLEEMDVPTRRKTKRFFDADRNLTAARAKKETAVGILHQEHNRAVAGGMAQAAVQAKAAPRAYAGRGR